MARDSNVIDWQEPRKRRYSLREAGFLSMFFITALMLGLGVYLHTN